MLEIEKRAEDALCVEIESYLWDLWDGLSTDFYWERILHLNYAYQRLDLDVQLIMENDSGVHFPVGVRVRGEERSIFNDCRARWMAARGIKGETE